MKVAIIATLFAALGATVEAAALPGSESLDRRSSYTEHSAVTKKVVVVKVSAPKTTVRKVVVVKKPVTTTKKVVVVKKPASSSTTTKKVVKVYVKKGSSSGSKVVTVVKKPSTTSAPSTSYSSSTKNYFGSTYAPSAHWKKLVADEHNAIRARVGYGLQPLVWDSYWGKKSCACAQKNADASTVTHCNAGENLWFTTNRKLTDDQIVKYAMDDFEEEKSLYTPGEPISVKKGYGHFTQIAWTDTKRVGCCIRYGGRGVVLSCLYDPVGNYKGDEAYGK
ncbi:hypothetical protein HK097_001323 [Rhizophlyctis rosea]|uniref:SCP domain-containing protein n=1 Tax=Rhizophlyctis rosea TaxID=64517 RepID=A0AAD5SJA3_9FUNG|nr:hypothetical protein HK097_001323 [Rhizophlyctis rosea]